MPGTLVWLTCPRRIHLVSKVEETKFLKELEREYHGKEQSELEKSHEGFESFLKGLIGKERYKRWLSANTAQGDDSIQDIVPKRHGNAGVSARGSVKCMHAHVAAFTAGAEDPVARRGIQQVAKHHIHDVPDMEDLLKEADNDDDKMRALMDCPAGCVQCRDLPNEYRYRRKRKRKDAVPIDAKRL